MGTIGSAKSIQTTGIRSYLPIGRYQLRMHVLRGGHVADVDGTRRADVAIEGGQIVEVGLDLDGDTETDISGSVLAPGLIDAHVHLMMDGRPDVATVKDDTAAEASYRAAANLGAAIESGVTTVRDLGAPDGVALAARDAVASGILPGPRVHACGRNIVMTGGHGHWFGREADGPTAVRTAAREQLKAGADVLKCMATGGVLTEGAVTGAPELTREEIEALTAAAEPIGVPTAAHAHGAEGIKNAVKAGISSVEHGTFMDREAAELMADHGTFWVPTVSALHGIVNNGIEAGIPASAVEKAEDAGERMGSAFEHAIDAGVTIAMGTDAGTPFNFFDEIPTEMAYMVEQGLSPSDALEAATVNAAALLGEETLGKIAEGYVADLVVLSADPNEDATAWQDPAQVYKAGDRVV